jgi:hypothetical protein
MNRVVLQRLHSDDQGTFGELTIPGTTLVTLELPWRDNARNKSCIPAGEYVVRWSLSPRLKKYTYEITHVPGRGGIRIHAGNFAGDRDKGLRSDSLGCPLMGMRRGVLHGQRAVLASANAVTRLASALGRKSFLLEVRDV